jgi:putative endonuclease
LGCRFLRDQGYKILFRNFKDRRSSEIDIVRPDGETLVFVEAKTRGDEELGRLIEAVDRQKQCAFPKAVSPGCECSTIPI